MAFQLKITIKNISNPGVWRRIMLDERITFKELHELIQLIFQWENYHLYYFSPTGYGSHPHIASLKEDDQTDLDAAVTQIREILGKDYSSFTYCYDIGDNWIHEIELEDRTSDVVLRPWCIAALGACPPEDCGGPWGYEKMKDILANPKHEEYYDYKEWLGIEKRWDPSFVDLNKINHLLEAHYKI